MSSHLIKVNKMILAHCLNFTELLIYFNFLNMQTISQLKTDIRLQELKIDLDFLRKKAIRVHCTIYLLKLTEKQSAVSACFGSQVK